MRQDEEEHGMQNDGGRILFYSSCIGMPRGAALPRGNQEAGSWESNWQMPDQQTRVERMLNWHREPESENSGSRAGRYFFYLSDGQNLKWWTISLTDSSECSLSSQHHWYHWLIPGKARRATSGASPVCLRRKKKVSSHLSGSWWPWTYLEARHRASDFPICPAYSHLSSASEVPWRSSREQLPTLAFQRGRDGATSLWTYSNEHFVLLDPQKGSQTGFRGSPGNLWKHIWSEDGGNQPATASCWPNLLLTDRNIAPGWYVGLDLTLLSDSLQCFSSRSLSPSPQIQTLLEPKDFYNSLDGKSWTKVKLFTVLIIPFTGLSRWLSGKESACQRRRHRRPGLNLWVGKIPWRRACKLL